jgi:phosphomethylpyrimidine synthase
MCGPKFCSMKISQDVRNDAARLNVKEQGMERMRDRFRDMGGRL